VNHTSRRTRTATHRLLFPHVGQLLCGSRSSKSAKERATVCGHALSQANDLLSRLLGGEYGSRPILQFLWHHACRPFSRRFLGKTNLYRCCPSSERNISTRIGASHPVEVCNDSRADRCVSLKTKSGPTGYSPVGPLRLVTSERDQAGLVRLVLQPSERSEHWPERRDACLG